MVLENLGDNSPFVLEERMMISQLPLTALGTLISALFLTCYCVMWVSATFTALWAPTKTRRRNARAVMKLLSRQNRRDGCRCCRATGVSGVTPAAGDKRVVLFDHDLPHPRVRGRDRNTLAEYDSRDSCLDDCTE